MNEELILSVDGQQQGGYGGQQGGAPQGQGGYGGGY